MPTFIALDGQRFGRLLVVERAPDDPGVQHPARWLCLCDCGNTPHVRGDSLRNGNTRSCGCLQRDDIRARATTHGAKRFGKASREWMAWANMRRRCFDASNVHYARYGGRGITVCQEWRDSFSAFLAHVGLCPVGMSLDRINNDGHYEPGNVRWATKSQQARNQGKRTVKTHCANGHELTGPNVRLRKNKNGQESRVCRTCHRLNAKSFRKLDADAKTGQPSEND